MPSPVGHALGGALVGVVLAPWGSWRTTQLAPSVLGACRSPQVAAAVLAGMLDGLENGGDPGPPMVGNAYEQTEARALFWRETIADFQASEFVRETFGERFRHMYGQQKLKELRSFYTEVTTLEVEWYLRQV